MRLNKFLAECGVCSRREADRLIEQGAVEINGRIAAVGIQVEETDSVTVHGKTVRKQEEKVVLAYNKPVGVTCTEKDKNAERTIADALQYPIRVTYAGRLDKDSEGLLIMTNDGDLIEGMMRGANCHEKEYVVRVDKPLKESFLEGMRAGVYLPDLEKTTRPCQVEQTGKNTFRIILTQGLNRQIRRMCKQFGYGVKHLKRIRVLNIDLGGLQSGAYREIIGKEREKLYEMVYGKQEDRK